MTAPRSIPISACAESGVRVCPDGTEASGQLPLFSETFMEALRAVVVALGGAKSVGAILWPEKGPINAGNYLRDCLDDKRRDVLHPDQILWLLSEGRKANCHVAMAFISQECGYQPPVAIEPDDEKASLQREFIQAQRMMAKLVARMERLA